MWHRIAFPQKILGPCTLLGARNTTIVCVRKGDKAVLAGDGLVTAGGMKIKPNAMKVRRIGANGSVLAGFAGATADCMSLMDRLEGKLDEYPGQLLRACVELAKMWRQDRVLRNLNATMIVADENISLQITGNGDVIEPEDGVVGIGSGGAFATAAARVLMDPAVDGAKLDAKAIALKAIKIAADMDTSSNHEVICEEIETKKQVDAEETTAE